MQTASFEIWTRDAVSISYDDNLYNISKSKVGDRSRGRPEGSLFNSYYTEV